MWVPPLRRDVAMLLDRSKNPFFEHAEAEYFLAERGNEVVGRIAAISNRLHNEIHEDRVGFFGFFESERDPEVAAALFATAAGWLGARGFDTMRGPASFSTNDECGLLVMGFDLPPTIMMPHNPGWYAELIEGAGFAKSKDLLVYEGGNEAGSTPPERIERAVRLVTERLGLTLRPLDMKNFRAEVERVKVLYNQCWEKNWGFVPMTEHEIDHLAEQFRPVVIADLVPFVEKDGVPVGFALALTDLNTIFRSNRQGYLLPVLPRLLWSLKRESVRRARILLLGVIPELRGKGIDAVLYHWIWTRAGKHGMPWGEAGWILEDNAAMNAGLLKMGFKHYKTYRMYDKALSRT
jgi:GNAT superfamily N-acetyltransferase